MKPRVNSRCNMLQRGATCCNMQWSAQAEKLASETPNVMATDIDAQIMGEDSEMQACRASTACCMLYIECCMLLPGEHSGMHACSAPLVLSGYSVGTR